MIRSLLVLAVVSFAACGAPSIIDGKKYKTECAAPADCAAVFFGDQCRVCACPNGAISSSDKVQYEADRSAAIATCGPRAAVACGPCEDRVLTCTAGVCGLQ